MTESSDNPEKPARTGTAQAGIFRPMGKSSTREVQADLGALIIAVALHAWGGASAAASLFDLNSFTSLVRSNVIERLEASIDIEPEQLEEPPEEEEEPKPEPEPVEEPEPEPVDIPAPTEDPMPTEPEATPAAAESGKVLTSEPDPNEPLDLTGEGFISGNGTRFSGGVTTADGTAKSAVRNRAARDGGVEGARGDKEGAKGTAPPAVDRSQPAGLPLGANWNSCGFPPEADAEQINQARVRLVVVVGADGRPTSVNILSDPGYGFGRIARNCAMRKTFTPGLDKNGNPAPRATRPFAITFTR